MGHFDILWERNVAHLLCYVCVMGKAVVEVAWLATHITGTAPSRISADIAALIADGRIDPGAQLPTARALAERLGVRLSAVTGAWRILRQDGLVETRRRGGTNVCQSPAAPAGRRELGLALADPAFVPDLTAVIVEQLTAGLSDSSHPWITPRLREAVAGEWPFPASDFTAAPGSHAAVHLAITALTRAGEAVVAADPASPQLAMLLRRHDRRVLPIRADGEGPEPDSLAAALREDPALIVVQSHWGSPEAATLTPRRRDDLATVLRGSRTWILEEDRAAFLRPGPSLGEVHPERTVRVVPFIFAFGRAAQVAVVGGAAAAIEAITRVQQDEGSTASLLLQDACAALLPRARTRELFGQAATAYRCRGERMRSALADRGVPAVDHGGLFVWIPVIDEAETILALAAQGIAVAPGSRGRLTPSAEAGVWVCTPPLPDAEAEIGRLAELLAHASTIEPQASAYM